MTRTVMGGITTAEWLALDKKLDEPDSEWLRAEDDGFREPPAAEEELDFSSRKEIAYAQKCSAARQWPPEGRTVNVVDDPPKEYDDMGGPDR